MDPIDDLVKDAMKALEATSTPRDYFDQLPDRINVRLEGSMQTDQQSADGTTPISDGVVRADAGTEDSGLHDIKELAQTAKRRVSRRQTSQHEIDETLLASTQSGLHAVALPDPAKMVQLPTVEEARRLARSTGGMAAAVAEDIDAGSERPAIAAREPAAERGKGVPAWMWAGGGLAAAAAAVMAFVVLGGKDAADQPPASEPSSAVQPAPRQEKAAAPPALEEGIATGGLADPAPPPMTDPAPAATAVAAEEEVARPEDTARERKAGDDSDKKKRKVDEVKKDGKVDKVEVKKDVKAEPKEKADPKKTKDDDAKKELEGAVLGAGDSDELGIGDALGGGDKKKKDEAPARTELSNQEVRDGLDAISGKAKACYGAHGQTGTVKVKLTISPSGKVTKASASGALAGTPAGDCVVAAVKSAAFPPWDGAPKSTSYVVLLSD